MQTDDENWDDLRFLLAVARTGSFLHAGGALRLAGSTVQRRIGALDQRLGLRLVDRLPNGVALTPGGRRMVELAEELELRIGATGRDMRASHAVLSGTIRVTAGEGYGAFLLQLASAFRAEHPEVFVELVLDHRMLDLGRREADIALRNVRPTTQALLGRRLGEIGYGLYASETYLARRPVRTLSELPRHDFVGFEGVPRQTPDARWIAQHGVTKFVLRTTSMALVRDAVARGHGIGALPHRLVQGTSLQRVLPSVELPSLPVWLVRLRELSKAHRVVRFAAALAEAFLREAARAAP